MNTLISWFAPAGDVPGGDRFRLHKVVFPLKIMDNAEWRLFQKPWNAASFAGEIPVFPDVCRLSPQCPKESMSSASNQ
jgi:hypothetical protein